VSRGSLHKTLIITFREI